MKLGVYFGQDVTIKGIVLLKNKFRNLQGLKIINALQKYAKNGFILGIYIYIYILIIRLPGLFYGSPHKGG